MKLVPWDVNDAMTRRRKRAPNRTSNLDILDEFLASGEQCVKLEDYPQGSPHLCAASFQQSVKRYNYPIEVTLKGGDVFMINLSLRDISDMYRSR